jgi:hypothetical protein
MRLRGAGEYNPHLCTTLSLDFFLEFQQRSHHIRGPNVNNQRQVTVCRS